MEHESNEYHYGQQGESREKIGLSLEDDSRDFSFHGLTSCEFDRWKVIDMSKGKEFLYRHRHRGPRGKTITNVSCIHSRNLRAFLVITLYCPHVSSPENIQGKGLA